MEPDKNLPMREKLDFKEVIFQMIIQAMKEIHIPEAYRNNVNLLESVLLPYHDKTYTSNIKDLDTETDEIINKFGFDHKAHKENLSVREAVENEKTTKKLGALMKLARRKGLLPEETISHVMGEKL